MKPCSYCGAYYHATHECPNEKQETYGERFSRLRHEQMLRNQLVENDLLPRLKMERKEMNRKDGVTWMVSIIHPDHKGGSTFFSERPGKDAREAALSYFNDPTDDNKGAALAHKDPEMTLIVVIDNEDLAPRRKAGKVTIFMPRQTEDGKFELIEFS
jgi:hypothetical protein